jgi:hypothetical protein
MVKRNNNRRRDASGKELPESAMEYRGPPIPRNLMEQRDLHTVVLRAVEPVTSSAGGVINVVFSDDWSTWTDAASFINVFDEFRTLCLSVNYFPNNRYSKTTTVCKPVIVGVDRDDGNVFSSYDVASNHSSSKLKSVEDPWFETVKMRGAEDAQFSNTTSFSPRFWIKTYSDGLSANTEYGQAMITALVQFRSRH